MTALKPRPRGAPFDIGATAISPPLPRPRRPLGQLLVEDGLITPEQKFEALAKQAEMNVRFGEVLVTQNALSSAQLMAAIAKQYGVEIADLVSIPADLELMERLGASCCLSSGMLPWRVNRGAVEIATSRPERFEEHRSALESIFGPVRFAVTSETDLHRAVFSLKPRGLTHLAEARLPLEHSCRTWNSHRHFWSLLAVMLGLLILSVWAPHMVLLVALGWCMLSLTLLSAVKLVAWVTQARSSASDPAPPTASLPVIPKRLPTVTILVPLFQERALAQALTDRLARLVYPPELIDICLVVEADDDHTREALRSIALPHHIRVIVVPEAQLKTKPRALNYALEFCRGSIIGIYDAEDAPEPDQLLKVVQRFAQAPPDVACLQGVLDYYNADQNWLSRCFAIEYATWFRLILPGFLRLGLVIPLGGTTLFFRRDILETVGGWDAHNVTEDADLGIRLVRAGYRVELLNTITYEEANCRVWPWVKQRSRWLKGYAVTWAVHSRRPVQLWKDLGAWRFFGVQLLLLGTLSQFALAPLLWSFWLIALGLSWPAHLGMSSAVIWGIAGLFVAAELISLGTRLHATRKTQHKNLLWWAPSLYLYFPLATLASYKALLELLTRPFFWDKTDHGVSEVPKNAAGPPSPVFQSRRRRS